VQIDSGMPNNILNYDVSTAVPALVTAVDERVGTLLGTAVSTMRTAANSVEVTTQKRAHNPRSSDNKSSVTRDGNTEVTPKKSNGPKNKKKQKQLVHSRDLVSWKLLIPCIYLMPLPT
jgi:hypothetical protein